MPSHPIEQPARRPLKIFAFDPMRGREPAGVLTVDVENERLRPGPSGARVRVVDYDGLTGQYYEPVDLDEAAILMAGGLEPDESDPRFHQQMVYAVAMKVIENFDRALGRRIGFRGRPLLVVPHAFRARNAFFHPLVKGVLFGYFAADAKDPGANIPGQPVFTCLSQDIIAHEVTHAVVNRLRRHYLEPTNRDVRAFHEGFCDIVAIFQHFSYPEVLREALRASRGDLRSSRGGLVDLAEQFGYATGRGGALRTALGTPNATGYATVTELYARGSLLVAAVFDGFFETYQGRVADLIRIATGGSGILPEGELPPYLIDRLAEEAADAARTVLTMCIRAFEYLPPVHLTYGDFLRALVTADHDLLGDAGLDQRRCMIEAFRRRGIYAEGVQSLSERALLWPTVDGKAFKPMPAAPIARQVAVDARDLGRSGHGASVDADEAPGRVAVKLREWALSHADALGLDPSADTALAGFHANFRVAASGGLLVEVVTQFVQTEKPAPPAGTPARGGVTVVATADGDVRFVIAKPLRGGTGQAPAAAIDFSTLHQGLLG